MAKTPTAPPDLSEAAPEALAAHPIIHPDPIPPRGGCYIFDPATGVLRLAKTQEAKA